MVDEITALIGELGFPIAITVYLLFRFDRLITKLTKSVESLLEEMKKHDGHQ